MHVAMAAMALAMMLGAAPVDAAEPPLMTMFDSNHDGCVSLDEYRAYMDQGFHRMDTDGNDVLDATELPSGNGHHAPLTLEQHHRNVEHQFKRQDVDHDGCLRLDELMAPPR